MSLLEEYEIGCPSCGELVTVVIDKSILQQQYTEDCFVCCRPIEMEIVIDGDDFYVSASHEDDV